MVALLSSCSAHAQVHKPYETWLNEDVRWITSDQERADFKKLSDDKQRDQFIEAFWAHRNPIPGSPENPFKEEHYRRIDYANQHFAERAPGWKTDRGRFYIMYGPPKFVLSYFSSDKSRGEKGCFDSEKWHWGQIEGVVRDVTLDFVSRCGSGEYHLTDSD